MKLLALDTSTEACSAALAIEDQVSERFTLGGNHSERILPMVHELLAEAGIALSQLDAIAFGRGPGSFTGLRIAAGVTQGLAFGANLPVVPVSSLAALAQGQDTDRVLAAFDARMQQVYWGAYVRNADGLMELTGTEIVFAPDAVPIPEAGEWLGAGSGWDRYAEVLSQRLKGYATGWRKQAYPTARSVAKIGRWLVEKGDVLHPDQAIPVYIRDEVAIKAK